MSVPDIYEGGALKPFEKVELRKKGRVTLKPRLALEEFVMAELSEEKIREHKERFDFLVILCL